MNKGCGKSIEHEWCNNTVIQSLHTFAKEFLEMAEALNITNTSSTICNDDGEDDIVVLTNKVTLNNECPTFKGYEKMPDNSKAFTGSLNHIKKWVVLEKIHGSNFSLTVWRKSDQNEEDIGVRLGRRTAYLRAEEKFFKIETQIEFQEHLKQCAINAWKTVCRIEDIGQIEAMTIFGELFGGTLQSPH